MCIPSAVIIQPHSPTVALVLLQWSHLVAEPLAGEAIKAPAHFHLHVARLLHPTGFGLTHNPKHTRTWTLNTHKPQCCNDT